VFAKKELELTKIREKNKRVKKILDDLGVQEPVYEPEMGSIEKPEMLLTTTDDEVTTFSSSVIVIGCCHYCNYRPSCHRLFQ